MWTLWTRAFLGETLPARLQLSEAQTGKIRETVTETQEAIGELRKQAQGSGTRDALEKKARELQVDEQKQILVILSAEQQQQWIRLLGKRIDVAKLGRVKFKAPALLGNGGWINSAPLTLRQLKGKVVALHFYAFA
jgi:hypothetical protein